MRDRIRQVLVLVFVILDIVSSFALGDSLDQTPGEANPVYFLPFGLTFAIWGVIFFSGLLYAIYQLLPAQRERALHRAIGPWVALNAALTALWNFVAGQAGTQGTPGFQPALVTLTVVILIGMLVSMTRVFVIFRNMHAQLTGQDRGLAQFYTTVFFAWLNVAAIANTTAALNAVGFNSNGAVWAAVLLVVAVALASAMIRYSRPGLATITYTGVIVWALIGIFFNNYDRSALVAVTSIAAGLVVIAVAAFHLRGGRAQAVRAAA
jgi:translocator protein